MIIVRAGWIKSLEIQIVSKDSQIYSCHCTKCDTLKAVWTVTSPLQLVQAHTDYPFFTFCRVCSSFSSLSFVISDAQLSLLPSHHSSSLMFFYSSFTADETSPLSLLISPSILPEDSGGKIT